MSELVKVYVPRSLRDDGMVDGFHEIKLQRYVKIEDYDRIVSKLNAVEQECEAFHSMFELAYLGCTDGLNNEQREYLEQEVTKLRKKQYAAILAYQESKAPTYVELESQLTALQSAHNERTREMHSAKKRMWEVGHENEQLLLRLGKIRQHMETEYPHCFERTAVWRMAAADPEQMLDVPHVIRGQCEWREVDEADCTTWESACGQKWEFTNDGPAENGVKFCQGCGKPIEIVEARAETEHGPGKVYDSDFVIADNQVADHGPTAAEPPDRPVLPGED